VAKGHLQFLKKTVRFLFIFNRIDWRNYGNHDVYSTKW